MKYLIDVRYNMVRDNLASHGLHPRVTHLLVNIPLLYNVLGLAALAATARISYA
jgi:phosphatidylinositol glycan class Z